MIDRSPIRMGTICQMVAMKAVRSTTATKATSSALWSSFAVSKERLTKAFMLAKRALTLSIGSAKTGSGMLVSHIVRVDFMTRLPLRRPASGGMRSFGIRR